MATVVDNTIQYTIKAKDEFTAALNGVSQKIKGFGPTLVEGLTVGAAAFNGFVKVAETGADILTGNYSRVGDIFRAIPGPVGEAAASIASFAGGAVEKLTATADAYDKLSKKTGASIEFLSQFTEAADDVRVSSEAVESGLTKFSRALGGVVSAEDGAVANGKPLAQTLKDIGVNVEDANGKLRSMEEILPQVADLFQSMPDGAQKTALAVQLFGRNGAELIPILNQGAAGMRDMMNASKELGTAFTQLDKEQMDSLKKKTDDLSDRIKGFQLRVGRELVGPLSDATGYMIEFGDAQVKARSNMTDLGKAADNLINLLPGLGAVVRQARYGDYLAEQANIAKNAGRGLDAFADSVDRVATSLGNLPIKAPLPELDVQGALEQGKALEDAAHYSVSLSDAQKRLDENGRRAADAQKLLADQINNLKGSLTAFPSAMTPLQQLQEMMGMGGAGKSMEQFGKEQFIGAIGQARQNKLITDQEAAKFLAEVTTTSGLSEESIKKVGQSALDAAKNIADARRLLETFTGEIGGRQKAKEVAAGRASYVEEDMGINTSIAKVKEQAEQVKTDIETNPYTINFREEGLAPIRSALDAIPTEKTVTVRIRGVVEGGSEAERLAGEEERLRLMRTRFATREP